MNSVSRTAGKDVYGAILQIDCVPCEVQCSGHIPGAVEKKYALHLAIHFELAAHFFWRLEVAETSGLIVVDAFRKRQRIQRLVFGE